MQKATSIRRDTTDYPSKREEAVAYGDLRALSRYAGISVSLPKNTEWQHGWIPSSRTIDSPEQIVGSDGRSRFRKSWKYLVARHDQAEQLRAFGYPFAYAVGLPIVYVPRPDDDFRRRESLLAVPHHSSVDSVNGMVSHQDFAEYLEAQVQHFAESAVLIHAIDWTQAVQEVYERAGLRTIRGADPDDSESLTRVVSLLSTFETVVSNNLGSPIAYAAYLGAKVAVVGSPPTPDLNHLYKNVFYRNCIEGTVEAIRWEAWWRRQPELEFLLRNPMDAQTAVEWGAFEVGAQHRLEPNDVRTCFADISATRDRPLHGIEVSPRRLIPLPHLRHLLRRILRRIRKRAKKYFRAIQRSHFLTVASLASGTERLVNLWNFCLGLTGVKRVIRLSADKAAADFEVRMHSSDIDNVVQHFARDEFSELRDEISRASLILDVGAYCGYATLRMREINPTAHIVLLEPRHDHVKIALRNTEAIKNITVLHGALWISGDFVDLAETEEGGWSSTIIQAQWLNSQPVHRSPVISWSTLASSFGLNAAKRVFAKLDVEGSEAAILSHFGEDILAACDTLVIEVHDWYEGLAAQVLGTLASLRVAFEFDMSEAGEFLVLRNIRSGKPL